MISKEQLKSIMPHASAESLEKFCQPLSEAMEKYQINTPNRIACFLAQLAHESGCLKYTQELASGMAYEGREDLGNVHPGDGKRFKGRGPIQITGRTNYTLLSKVFGVDLVIHPELLEGPVYGSLAAAWFWDSHHLNELADVMNFEKITRRINGGLNGYEDRLKYLALAKQTLGIHGTI